MELRYWDACAFLGLLKKEPDKWEVCRAVLQEAKAGNIQIVTSALTLVEVIKLKRRVPIGPEDAERIKRFFKHKWIDVRNLERYTAETAREMVWEHGVEPKDAVNVATAVRSHIARLDTFDDDLVELDGRIGEPPLQITYPSVNQQALALEPKEDELDDQGQAQ